MLYKVKIEKHVSNYIRKLDNKEYFLKRFKKLETNKKGYRLLDTHKSIELWELRSKSHRVYYTVENGFIVINTIEYDGTISVCDAGNKNKQTRAINKLKTKIRQ